MAQIDLRAATVTIKDGGSNTLTAKIGEGTLTYDVKRTMEYVRDRRQIAFVRSGDEEASDVSFQFVWEFLTSATGEPVTVEEALRKTGAAASWTTSGSDPCEPYAVDVVITYTPPCTGVQHETITLPEFRWEGLKHDLKAGTVDVSGKCKVVPYSVRAS